jgi:hypothetical protein
VDYSWVWAKKNVYGFVEFFYSGAGRDDYTRAIFDPQVTDRIDRGELFTLGKYYLSGHVRVELPLSTNPADRAFIWLSCYF